MGQRFFPPLLMRCGRDIEERPSETSPVRLPRVFQVRVREGVQVRVGVEAAVAFAQVEAAVGALGGVGDPVDPDIVKRLTPGVAPERFDTQVMLLVIAVLIALVTVVQVLGDRYVRRLRSR